MPSVVTVEVARLVAGRRVLDFLGPEHPAVVPDWGWGCLIPPNPPRSGPKAGYNAMWRDARLLDVFEVF